MRSDQLKIEQHDNTTVILINHPSKHNALSPSLLNDLTTAISEAPKLMNILLASTSEIFCSGLDINHLEERWGNKNELEEFFEMLHTLYLTIYAHPASTVAIVQKGAFGGGFGLACCCDLVLARKESRFVLPGNRFGNLARLARPPIRNKFQSIKLEDVSEIELTGEAEIFKTDYDAVSIPVVSEIDAFFYSIQPERERRLLRSSQADFAKSCKYIKTLVLNDHTLSLL